MSKPQCFLFIVLLQLGTLLVQVRLEEGDSGKEFLLLTVATNETDGFNRFVQSAEYYKIPIKVLGRNEAWVGGSMSRQGGGQKVNLLRKTLKKLKEMSPDLVVMFTDGYDVVLTGDAQGILKKFASFDAKIVFSAEVFCWPAKSLADSYPPTESPYKYLNSGGFIGYVKDIYELIRNEPIKDDEDDQLYYTKLFLNKNLRERYRMRLDTKATIFQNLNGVQVADLQNNSSAPVGPPSFSRDVKLEVEDSGDYVLLNSKFGTKPSVVHGNGWAKLTLNSLANYLGGAWHAKRGCTQCLSSASKSQKDQSYPIVVLGIFITQKTPFIDEFFAKIGRLDYPKNKMHLFLYNNVDYHKIHVIQYVEKFGNNYISVKEIKPSDDLSQVDARNLAMDFCTGKECGYLFSVDSTAHLDNPHAISYLIDDKRGVVAPLLVRPYKAWSNFWGDLNTDGFYSRSFDYMDIVNNEKRGVWNVPFIGECYLVNATLLPHIKSAYADPYLDPDMAFCKQLRDKGIFMFVDNLVDIGHLVDAEHFLPEGFLNAELYELSANQWDWEQRYIHQDYAESLKPDAVQNQPCPDVYWFPIVTPRFCKELIEIMEAFGQWSSGTNHSVSLTGGCNHTAQSKDDSLESKNEIQQKCSKDERLSGGYENVPTRDIHMNQVGLEPLWLQFLQLYVRPLQEAVFAGYFHDPPKSLMNFVVRYRPDEQPYLRPHHDSSTYTINIALNRPDIDYKGGGCRFIRYKCSVTNTKVGWMLMHPGRLTHYHEGLPVTNGTRYIMISFVDP